MNKTELSRLEEGDRVKVQIGPFNQLNGTVTMLDGTVTMLDGALRILYDESRIVSSPLSELR